MLTSSCVEIALRLANVPHLWIQDCLSICPPSPLIEFSFLFKLFNSFFLLTSHQACIWYIKSKKHHNLTFQREPESEPEWSKESQRCGGSNQKEKFLANLSGSHWLSLAHSPTLFGSHWLSLQLFDSLWLSPAHYCSLISLIYSPCWAHKALARLTAQLPRWRTLSQSAFWKACISLNAKQL